MYYINSEESNYTDIILKSFDSLLKDSNDMSENALNRLIELYSPKIEKIKGSSGNVYYNNEINVNSDISGIIFTVYDQYSTELNEIIFYVYDK